MVTRSYFCSIFVYILIGGYHLTHAEYAKPCIENYHFCSGPVLDKVQMSHIFKDSKTFVDMPLKQNWTKEIEDDILNTTSKSEINAKINKYFFKAGTKEWHHENVSDWKEHPKILDKIKDENYKNWAKHLCGLWNDLVRKMNQDVDTNNQRYSMIYLKENLVVPGGRFREVYYWDTYWSVEGLLHCEMYTTTKHVLENLLQLVEMYGFVPNGGRKYYENRSQPPFLSLMVLKYWQTTKDSDFVIKHCKTLLKEYKFWTQNRAIAFNTTSKQYTLNRYFSKLGYPRPESYKEDVELIKEAGFENDTEAQREMYSHIATAAESGWDFSSRWFADFKTMKTITTSNIIPVDLNSIICAVEFSLAYLVKEVLNDPLTADELLGNAQQRRKAIDQVLWNRKTGIWSDFNHKKKTFTDQFYSSNIFPLWISHYDYTNSSTNYTLRDIAYKTLKKLKVLSFPGGVPASLIDSGQQWDFPNAWAPLQHIIVYALDERKTELKAMKDDGKLVAKRFIENAYIAWKKSGHMFEKYNVQKPGKEGHGGEYGVQLGFGWSNGVVLDFLAKYGDDLNAPNSNTQSSGQTLKNQKVKCWFILFSTLILTNYT